MDDQNEYTHIYEENEGQPLEERVKIRYGLSKLLNLALILIIISYFSPNIITYISSIIYPPQIADTTAFKASFHEFSKLAKIDYYPMKRFSSDIWDAAKNTTDIKYQLRQTLSKTTLSDDTKNQYSKYFDRLGKMFKDLQILSDESADFYSQQMAAFSTFEYSTQRMKRMVQRSDLKGLMLEIEHFTEYFNEAADKLHKLKHEYIRCKRQAQQYYNQAIGMSNDMKCEFNEEKESEAWYNKFITKLGYGNNNDMMTKFEDAENDFNETARILDYCVEGICLILGTIRDVQSNLAQSSNQLKNTWIKTSSVKCNRLRIDDDDKQELSDMLDVVKQQFEKSSHQHHFV